MALRLKQLKTFRVTVPEAHRVQAANADTLEPARPDAAAPAPAPAPAARAEKPERSAAPPRSDKPATNASVESVFDASDQFSKMESRVALSAFGFIVFVLTAAWFSWDEQYSIVGDADSAYNYGLVGGIMMLVILVYALRKRLRSLSRLGDIRYWYYFHFILGIVGPVLIILHTSFGIRSINGGVALFAMLIVVFSGFIGRYIYTRASYGLRTHEQDLQVMQKHISDGVLQSKLPALQLVESHIKEFTDHALRAPGGVDDIVKGIFTMRLQASFVYRRINTELTRTMISLARAERWSVSDLKAHLVQERILLRGHLTAAAKIGKFQAFEKLAGRWRLLHVPLLYLLVLSGLAHVLAVHMY